MDNKFHEEWVTHLRDTAKSWHFKYNFIDEEEAFSELLVEYADALNHFDENKGIKFDTFFYFYKHRAFHNLYEEAKTWNDSVTLVETKDLDLFAYERDTIHNLLIELDKVCLSDDAKKMLDFILNTDLTADKAKSRVGRRTVVDKATKLLNWTYDRANRAVDCLKMFYGERALA